MRGRSGAFNRGDRRSAHRAVGDIRRNGVIEQRHVLRHQGDLRAQRFQRQRRDVVAVDEQPSRRRLVEAWNQIDERRFAAAGAADQRDCFTGTDRHRDIDQRFAFGGCVAQRHAIETDLAACSFEHDRPGVRLLFAVEQTENALGTCQSALNRRVDAGQRLQPLEQRQKRHEIRREHAEIELARLILRQRDPDDHADGDRGKHLCQRRARSARGRLLGHRIAQRVGRLDRASAFVRFAAEYPDDAVAADHFFEDVRHRAGPRLHVARDPAQPTAEVADHDRDDWQHEESHQRKAPIDPHEPAEARGDR